MTPEQVKRMKELKLRVWAHHTWHINLAIGLERAFDAARAREMAEVRRRLDRESFEAARPKLDALIADMKERKRKRMSREWSDSQLGARAVARDALLDGRLNDAAAALRDEGMAVSDMLQRLHTEPER